MEEYSAADCGMQTLEEKNACSDHRSDTELTDLKQCLIQIQLSKRHAYAEDAGKLSHDVPCHAMLIGVKREIRSLLCCCGGTHSALKLLQSFV